MSIESDTDEQGSKPPSLSPQLCCRVKTGFFVAFLFGIIFWLTGLSVALKSKPIAQGQWPLQSKPVTEEEWMTRTDRVKDALLDAWNAYDTYAWGADQLKPVEKEGVSRLNDWGLTIYDSLSTFYVMNLTNQSAQALSFITNQNNFTLSHSSSDYAPFFETVIRYLGSMLSTYALTGNEMLLSRADELGTKLLPAFDTPSGLPRWGVDVDTGNTNDVDPTQPYHAVLAEIASCQMEFKYLAHLTGKREYFDKVNRVIDILQDQQYKGFNTGMWPTVWNVSTGAPANLRFSIGSESDSAYEYLLKGYLLSGRTEKRLLDIYKNAMTTLTSTLLFLSPTRQFLYVTDRGNANPTVNSTTPSGDFEHLSCFLPGLLALGADVLSVENGEVTSEEVELWKWAAEGLGWGCLLMYFDQPTGIGPDVANVDEYEGDPEGGNWMIAVKEWESKGGMMSGNGKPPGVGMLPNSIRNYGKLQTSMKSDYIVTLDNYYMRPETIESMYVLYRTTGDPKWREAGWEIFLALESYTKLDGSKGDAGYSSISGVDSTPSWIDEMPSYALAETWKYLYLLCLGLDNDPLPKESWIFTTEAHPLPVFEWTASQITDWDIR